MKKFSKLFWVLLVVVAVLTVTAVGALATGEQSTAIVYGDAESVDTTFDVVFKVKNNNTKVECGKITLTWDADAMAATAIKLGGDLGNAQYGWKPESGKAVIAWAGSAFEATDGELFTVTFTNKTIEKGEFAEVDIEVDNFGYTNGFVATELKNDVSVNNAFATNGEVEKLTFDGSEDPIVVLNQAVSFANTGKDVTLELSANMTINSTNTDKVFYVGYDSALNENAGTVTVVSATSTDGAPNYGISVDSVSIVVIKGNMNFNNANVSSHYAAGKTSRAYGSGGCLLFVEGLGTFGHDDTETADDFGNIGYVNLTPHVSGHVHVYAGKYYSISGNFNISPVAVETPDIIVGGNAETEYVMGGSHNGNANSKVIGETSVLLTDNAKVGQASVGSWYNSTYKSDGGSMTVEGNVTVSGYISAGCIGPATVADNALYKLTVNGGSIGTVAGHVFNALSGKATTNVEIELNGGTYSGIYGGSYTSTSTGSSKSEYTTATHTEIYGKSKLTINTAVSCVIFGGSRLRGGYNIHDMETTLIIDGAGTDKQNTSVNIYAGSYIDSTSKWTNTNGTDDKTDDVVTTIANTNNKHLGTINITLKNGAYTKHYVNGTNNYGGTIYCGSYFATAENCSHNTVTTVSAIIDDETSEYSVSPAAGMYLGSYFSSNTNTKNCEHAGTTTATIENAVFNTQTSGFVSFAVGSVLNGTNKHTATSTVTLKNCTASKAIMGGSYISNALASHVGNSTLTLEGVTHTHTGEMTVFGGSCITAAGGEHVGNSELIIKHNFSTTAKRVFGGSYMRNIATTGEDKGGHTGSSTLTIIGADPTGTDSDAKNNKTYSDLITFNVEVYGGSWLRKEGNEHSGPSHLNLYNLYNHSTYQGENKYNIAFTGSGKFMGGSFIDIESAATAGAVTATHSGSSQVYVRSFTTSKEVYGGSYINGHGIHSGTSRLVWDANIGVDENLTETEGKGWAISNSNIFGGSLINGWYSNDSSGVANKVSTGFNTGANQTGDSFLDVYSRTNGTTGDQRDRATIEYAFAGNYYTANNTNQQVCNSTFTIHKGTLNYGKNIYGGSKYNCNLGNVEPETIPTSKVVLTGNAGFHNPIYGGSWLQYSNGTGTMYCNTAIILNGTAKNLRPDLYAGSHTSNSHTATQKGDAFIELGPNVGFYSYNTSYPSLRLNSNNTNITLDSEYESRLKIVGALPSAFTTKIEYIYAFDTLDLYRSTITDPATIKDKSGNVGSFGNVIYPFEDGTVVTLQYNGAAIAKNQVLTPTQVLQDLVPATYTTPSGVEFTYAEVTAFDHIAENDNAFVFYDAGKDPEEAITTETLPTHVTSLILGVGDLRTAAATEIFRNEFRVGAAGMFLDSAINFYVGYKPDVAAKYGYTDMYVEVSVAENNYTFKETKLNAGYECFIVPMIPQHMCEVVTATLYATNSDGELIQTAEFNYSPYQYTRSKLGNGDENLRKLVVALMQFGDAAQIQFNYKAEEATLATTLAAITDDEATTYATPSRWGKHKNDLKPTYETLLENPTLTFKAATLQLNEKIDTYYSFIIDESFEGNVNDIVFKFEVLTKAGEKDPEQVYYVDYEDCTIDPANTSRMRVCLKNVNSNQMSNLILVTAYVGETPISNTLSYSVESYAARNAAATGTLKDVIDAMIIYGDASYNYNPCK